MKKLYFNSIYWSSPLPPPIGFPRVLAKQFVLSDSVVTSFPELQALYFERKKELPKGYSIGWNCLTEPPKTRSDAFRASARIRAMKNRILKKVPLFADEFIDKELTENAGYYSGRLDADTLAFRSELQTEYSQALSLAGSGVVVHFEWWNHQAVFPESVRVAAVSSAQPSKPKSNAHQFSLFEILKPFALKQFNSLRELYKKFHADLQELKNPSSRLSKILGSKACAKASELSNQLKTLAAEIRWLYSLYEFDLEPVVS